MQKEKCYKVTSSYPKIKLKYKTITVILKKINVNVSKKIHELQTTYASYNAKQVDMPYFHCGPSRQEKF